MNAQTKHTPGPWRYEHAAGHAYDCIRGSESVHIRGNLDIPGTNSWSDRICENLGGDTPTVRANVKLICEAGTVANETGLTPRQLADQRAELLEALRNALDTLLAYDGHATNPINAEGWTDPDAYAVYMKGVSIIAKAVTP